MVQEEEQIEALRRFHFYSCLALGPCSTAGRLVLSDQAAPWANQPAVPQLVVPRPRPGCPALSCAGPLIRLSSVCSSSVRSSLLFFLLSSSLFLLSCRFILDSLRWTTRPYPSPPFPSPPLFVCSLSSRKGRSWFADLSCILRVPLSQELSRFSRSGSPLSFRVFAQRRLNVVFFFGNE